MFKDVLNANRTRYNIKRKQGNYIHWKYYKDYGVVATTSNKD